MDRCKSKTPDRGIQEISFVGFQKTLGSMNIESSTRNGGEKENSNPYLETQLVTDLKKEVSDLTGRLFEARSSRDAALRKNVQMQEEHLKSLRQMQDIISKLELNNSMLQKERDVDTFSQLRELEEEVEKVRCEKTDLRLRMDNLAKDNSIKDEKINELNQVIRKLESSYRHLENQKADLLESAGEQKRKEQEYEMQKGAFNVLQQQLSKCEASLEKTKDELNEEKMRCRDLERMLASVENELTTFKVDVRLLTREKKELEDKLNHELGSSKSSRDKFIETQQAKLKAEENVRELERKIKGLQKELEEKTSLCQVKDQVIQDKNSQHQTLLTDLQQVKKELEEKKIASSTNEKYRATSTQLAQSVKDKDRVLAEKDKKIEKLQHSARDLKKAVILLENQLKEFEDLFSQKQNELESTIQMRAKAEENLSNVKDELRQTKIALNEATSLKVFTEKRLATIEASLHSGETEKLNEIQSLKTQIVDLKRSKTFLEEKMSDLLDRLDSLQVTKDQLTQELQASKEEIKKSSDNYKSENTLLKEENTRILTEIMKLKEANNQLKTALEQAISKCESYKEKLESTSEDLALLEVGKAENELRLQSTINQQIKLIDLLKQQNDLMSAKKKKNFAEKLFTRDHHHHKENKESCTPLSHLTKPIPASTPRRLIQEHKVVKNLEEEAALLKNQLAQLQNLKEVGSNEVERVEVDEIEEEKIKETGVQKHSIFQDEGNDRLDVNCVKSLFSSVYLFGCEQGLFSRRIAEDQPTNYVVEIGGCGQVYQIEFITSLNYAILIEGKDRKLAIVHLSLLRACAEAAACSKPKLKLQYIGDLKNCHSFQVQKTADRGIFIIVALQKYLNIVFWEKDAFVVRHRLKTPDTVTCMLATPSSVIFGCDKIFEMDIKNYTMEEFMDESDESMMYAMLACRESLNYPVAILDVSKSNMTPGAVQFNVEYLLCFPDLAIFVDAYGRRTRSEDILWSKLPLGVFYSHPDLFVIHFNSVEIIPIRPTSYTKTRVIESLDSVGEDIVDIPESRFISLPNARFLGNSEKSAALIVGSLAKTKFEVFEVETSANCV